MITILLVIESFAQRTLLGATVVEFLLTSIAMAVFFVVFQGRREKMVALVTAVVGLGFGWLRYFTPAAEYGALEVVAHHVLIAVFLGFAVAVILGNVRSQTAISGDDVWGAICGYLLAASLWANLYAATYVLIPDSFTIGPGLQELAEGKRQTALYNYFSVVTSTTMGYGDITPARPPATALAMLEAIFGQFYIAIVVAQLVGARLSQALASDNARPQQTPAGPT
jgi:hypothetical protein